MIAFLPTVIPTEPGCCAVRVFEPETPQERDLAAYCLAQSGPYDVPMWRVVYWADGRAYLRSLLCICPPHVGLMHTRFTDNPSQWAELIRGKAA